jgi:hypothetical protein
MPVYMYFVFNVWSQLSSYNYNSPKPVCLSNVCSQWAPNDYNSPNTSLPACLMYVLNCLPKLQQSQHLSACLTYVLNYLLMLQQYKILSACLTYVLNRLPKLQQSQLLSACLMYVLNCLPMTTTVPTPLCLSNVRAELSPNNYNIPNSSLPV